MRVALTLVELLVATAITLVPMVLMMQALYQSELTGCGSPPPPRGFTSCPTEGVSSWLRVLDSRS